MKKKALILLFPLLILSLFLIGCEEQRNSQLSEAETTDYTIKSNRVSGVLTDNISIDAVINLPAKLDEDEKNIAVYNAAMREFDKTKVINILEPKLKPEQYTYHTENVFGTELETAIYNDENASFNIGHMIYYESKACEFYSYLFREDLFESKKTLTFEPEEQALEHTFQILEELGISRPEWKKTYYMEKESLKEAEKEQSAYEYFADDLKKGKALYRGEWKDSDACYVFDLTVSVDSIPVLEKGYLIDDYLFVFGGGIRVFYSKDGIIGIEVEAVYDAGEISDTVEIAPLDTVLNQLKAKYESIMSDEKLEISNIGVKYIPEPQGRGRSELKLIPVWEVILKGQDGDNQYEIAVYYTIDGKKEKVLP
ncbi:hypothetical protein AALA00_09480 [Lachnospiraceae bacterium 46-15]